MKKLLLLVALIIIAGLTPQKSLAASEVARTSAMLSNPALSNTTPDKPIIDMRAHALENVLERHNSPIADQASNFVKYADMYGVDWKLLPAISGLESSFGIHLNSSSYNGYGWGGGQIYFESWEDGIRTIDQALRQNYIDKGATDVWSIGPIYAESPTWSVRVNNFMNEFNEEYLKLSTLSAIPNI